MQITNEQREQIKKNITILKNYILEIEDEERKLKLLSLFFNPEKESIEYKLARSFYVSPASAKESYHNAFQGGLLAHSLGVIQNILKLSETFCPGKYTKSSLVTVALLHDFSKAGSIKGGEVVPYYIPAEQWKAEKLGQIYDYNYDMLYLAQSHRTMYLLMKFGIKLTEEEFQAITIADGQYVDSNKMYAHKEQFLSILLHFADMLAMLKEKGKY